MNLKKFYVLKSKSITKLERIESSTLLANFCLPVTLWLSIV